MIIYTFSFRILKSNIIQKRKKHLTLSLYLIRKEKSKPYRCFNLLKIKFLIKQ